MLVAACVLGDHVSEDGGLAFVSLLPGITALLYNPSSSCVISLLQVHRKTLNPVFNETFQFGVPLNELHSRKLHFSVYDFDRFSRHDLIGQVVVDNLLDFSEGSGDKPIWRDIVEGTAVGDDSQMATFTIISSNVSAT